MVYNTGHISGGHLNPSVTLSLLFAGKMEIFHASCYIFVQFLAAVLAAWTAHGVLGSKAAYPLPGNGYSNGTAFTVEMLYNTLLVMVVLHTACTKKTEGNTYYGVAIGFTVLHVFNCEFVRLLLRLDSLLFLVGEYFKFKDFILSL